VSLSSEQGAQFRLGKQETHKEFWWRNVGALKMDKEMVRLG